MASNSQLLSLIRVSKKWLAEASVWCEMETGSWVISSSFSRLGRFLPGGKKSTLENPLTIQVILFSWYCWMTNDPEAATVFSLHTDCLCFLNYPGETVLPLLQKVPLFQWWWLDRPIIEILFVFLLRFLSFLVSRVNERLTLFMKVFELHRVLRLDLCRLREELRLLLGFNLFLDFILPAW